jgi:hypothetical protein
MVNDRFPEPALYGFEKVDAAGGRDVPPDRSSIENLHRIE